MARPNFAAVVPDVVACWCDARRSPLHSASCRMGGSVSVLWDSQPRRWCRLRGQQGGLAPLAPVPVPVTTGMAVAQGPRAGHILRYTVICGHGYGPMEGGSVWQLEERARDGGYKIRPEDQLGVQVLQDECGIQLYREASSISNKHMIHLIVSYNCGTFNEISAKHWKMYKMCFK